MPQYWAQAIYLNTYYTGIGADKMNIETQTQYETVVQSLVDELSAEFGDIDPRVIAESIANQVLMGVKIQQGKPITLRSGTYEGGSLAALDSALQPGDVLKYTHASNIRDRGCELTNFRQAAVDALAEDITTTHRQSYEPEGPQEQSH